MAKTITIYHHLSPELSPLKTLEITLLSQKGEGVTAFFWKNTEKEMNVFPEINSRGTRYSI